MKGRVFTVELHYGPGHMNKDSFSTWAFAHYNKTNGQLRGVTLPFRVHHYRRTGQLCAL